MYTINYDNLNRPDITTISYIPGGNITLNNDYDRYGNKDTLTLTDNNGVASHQYTYNKLNRLNNAVLPGEVNVGFDYFDNNRLKQLQFPNSLNIDYTFEANGAVNNIKLSDSTSTIEQLTYAYDDVNNVDTITHAAGGVHDYDYDNVYRLSQATHPAGLGIPTTESFEYDTVGNRETPGDGTQYDYDINNRISKSPGITSYGYDNDGNTTSLSTGETYAYNHLNRLTDFTKASLIADYNYDSRARRIYKSINGVETWYLWDGGKLLAEYNNAGQRDKRYAYLPNRHTPTQMQDNNGTYTSFSDHLDAPKLLVDASSTITWNAAYESFGTTSVSNNPDGDSNIIEFNMRFPGQYYDQETNLYYNYYRYYDPETGRYITSDPIGLVGGINTYAYVENNPLNFIDPSGLGPATARAVLAACTAANIGATLGLGYDVDAIQQEINTLNEIINKYQTSCNIDSRPQWYQDKIDKLIEKRRIALTQFVDAKSTMTLQALGQEVACGALSAASILLPTP